MDKVTLTATEVTFDVILDPTGSIEMVGRSTPENSSEFFSPLIEWAEKYVDQVAGPTAIRLQIEYINSSSTKYLYEFLKRFETIEDNDKGVNIEWQYEEDDMSIQELGEEFDKELNLPIRLIPITV